MPYSEPFNGYYKDIIRPAIEEADLKPLRGDEIEKPGAIVNQIWNELQKAAICVADLSTGNENVMYELGLAHARRIPVVQIVNENSELPFDLRNCRHIFYNPGQQKWKQKLRSSARGKHRWKHELRRDLVNMLRAARESPRRSIALDAPKNLEKVRCRGTLTELSLCSKSALKPIGNDAAVRTYSPLEDVTLITTDDTAEIRLSVEVMRQDGRHGCATFSGSGPLSPTRRAYMTYTLEGVYDGLTRGSMGVVVLDLSKTLEISGLWATADNDEEEFVVGLINLEKLGKEQ